MKIIALIALTALAGCAGRSVRVEVQRVEVKVPVACPPAEIANGLLADRPIPLRSQPMPAEADVRSAKRSAQLGRFEAEGGWADRVEAALRRCQTP